MFQSDGLKVPKLSCSAAVWMHETLIMGTRKKKTVRANITIFVLVYKVVCHSNLLYLMPCVRVVEQNVCYINAVIPSIRWCFYTSQGKDGWKDIQTTKD